MNLDSLPLTPSYLPTHAAPLSFEWEIRHGVYEEREGERENRAQCFVTERGHGMTWHGMPDDSLMVVPRAQTNWSMSMRNLHTASIHATTTCEPSPSSIQRIDRDVASIGLQFRVARQKVLIPQRPERDALVCVASKTQPSAAAQVFPHSPSCPPAGRCDTLHSLCIHSTQLTHRL